MAGVFVVLVGALALFSVSVSGEQQWCNLTCPNPYTHQIDQNTMCIYKEKTSTRRCRSIEPSMTKEQRVDLLKQHNEYRNKLAGGKLKGWRSAANMRLLTWDDDLERSAQMWASQCIFGHDNCRRTPNFLAVGQNAAWWQTVDGDGVSIKGWTDEEKLASPGKNYDSRGGYGHFSQVIWAKTHKLGCGEVTYIKNGKEQMALFCNYGPAGNYPGKPMYRKGKPCTKCPRGTRCFPDSKYPNLCATKKEIKSLSK